MERELSLGDLLRQRIRAVGPIPFSEFMEVALYEPAGGYYCAPVARTGRSGDFVTSPTLSGVFGRTLARLLPRIHAALGGPRRLRIVDAGAGEGALLDTLVPRVVALLPDAELEIVLVERGEFRRQHSLRLLGNAGHEVISLSDCEELRSLIPAPGLVIANELFDALPVRRLRRSQAGVEELMVEVASDGSFVERWSPTVLPPSGRKLPPDRESTEAIGVEALVSALSLAIDRGVVLVIDYGYPASILDDEEGPGSPARGFRGGALVTDLLSQPGATDLTANVDFTRVHRAARALALDCLLFTEQYRLLLDLGFLEDPRAAAAKRLIHPEDAGGTFKCLLLGKGIDAARLQFTARDHTAALNR